MGSIRGVLETIHSTHIYIDCLLGAKHCPGFKRNEAQPLALVRTLGWGGWTCKQATLTLCITGVLNKKWGMGSRLSAKLLREGTLFPLF